MSQRFLVPTIDSDDDVTYLLRDNFNEALTAGNIDTTSANVGPGTRSVTDTENKLSIGA